MALIESAGAVLYTEDGGVRQYVLVMEKNGSLGLPKGHVEPGETLAETALREVWEETGICAILHTMQPVMVDEYPIAGGDVKRVSWFVAHYHDQTPLADPTQVLDVRVLPLREAHKGDSARGGSSAGGCASASEEFLREWRFPSKLLRKWNTSMLDFYRGRGESPLRRRPKGNANRRSLRSPFGNFRFAPMFIELYWKFFSLCAFRLLK